MRRADPGEVLPRVLGSEVLLEHLTCERGGALVRAEERLELLARLEGEVRCARLIRLVARRGVLGDRGGGVLDGALALRQDAKEHLPDEARRASERGGDGGKRSARTLDRRVEP